jgi:hypothetical protein
VLECTYVHETIFLPTPSKTINPRLLTIDPETCDERPALSPGEVRLLEYFEAGALEGKRLSQFEKYAIGTYRVPQKLKTLSDARRRPDIPTFEVVNALVHAALLRIPSLNILEQDLETPEFQRLLGLRPRKGKRPFSADTMADVLDGLDVPALASVMHDVVATAERNKAFRDDTYGIFRCVALDGWEPFCTYHQHCEGCLTRQVKRKVRDEDGELVEEKVTQYFHRFVVAFLVAPTLDLTLATLLRSTGCIPVARCWRSFEPTGTEPSSSPRTRRTTPTASPRACGACAMVRTRRRRTP